ncbi:hypothetical protein [Nocardia sp. NPDC051463]|uniref:hypothetical protein n=1 Tax=Nocardia sp. NPDC051463 TaxID=3154845 RepID=UPI00342F27F0
MFEWLPAVVVAPADFHFVFADVALEFLVKDAVGGPGAGAIERRLMTSVAKFGADKNIDVVPRSR